GQRPPDRGEVAGLDAYVAVDDDQPVVLGVPGEIGEVADLQVGPDRAVVDHERQLDVREVLDQPVDDGNGRVLPVAHTEDDLEGGILLPAKAGQVFVELSVIAAQRLQDRHRWRTRGDAAPRSAVAGRAP